MPGATTEQSGVLAEQLGLHARVRCGAGVLEHSNVGPTFEHRIQKVTRMVVDVCRNLAIRVFGAEASHGGEARDDAGVRRECDVQCFGSSRKQFLDLANECLMVVEQHPAAAQDDLAEFRYHDAPSDSIEQLDAQIGLECLNTACQRRLGNAQCGGRAPEMRVFGQTECVL